MNPSEAANTTVPRMGTPQNDTSWAGWAISSFTNKVASASGEMEPSSNGTATKSTNRSTSLPPTADIVRPASSTGSASTLHRQALAPPSAPVLIRTTTDDFFNAAQNEDDELDDAWGDLGDEAFFDAPSEAASTKTSTPAPAFDDGGEPDFTGWLNAQAQAKGKKPLPKGLTKASASTAERPGVAGRTTTTGSVGAGAGARKLAGTSVKPKVLAAKKIDTKPKDEGGEDDGWGDAWD